jgi:hypothetical protein
MLADFKFRSIAKDPGASVGSCAGFKIAQTALPPFAGSDAGAGAGAGAGADGDTLIDLSTSDAEERFVAALQEQLRESMPGASEERARATLVSTVIATAERVLAGAGVPKVDPLRAPYAVLLQRETAAGLRAAGLDDALPRAPEHGRGAAAEQQTMRQLCDPDDGPAAEVAALSPASLMREDGLPEPARRADCLEVNDLGIRPEVCVCKCCNHERGFALQREAATAALRLLNNETASLDQYLAEHARALGRARYFRETVAVVGAYIEVFKIIALPYSEDRATLSQCVARLRVAHAAARSMIAAARSFYFELT